MGVSEKALKTRIKSVRSTEHITRAMQLVASSKLRRATERMEISRAYFSALRATFDDIAEGCGIDAPDAYFKVRTQGKTCIVTIAGDRGLAGGYNNNVYAMTRRVGEKETSVLYPIGKRAHEYFKKKGYEFACDLKTAEGLQMDECASIGREIAEGYASGKYNKVMLVYTAFRNMLSQETTAMQVLPLEKSGDGKEKKVSSVTIYEPSAGAVFKALIPEYVSGMIYCALCQSGASEQAARRNAMDSATKNAGEMIEKLSLQYNRARQGSITQEIIEIVAGSEQ